MTAATPSVVVKAAPKHLAMLASSMRDDWTYEDTRQALIAVSGAGWSDVKIYQETFRLLLLPDSQPADLRNAARRVPRPTPGEDTFRRGLAAAREALEGHTGPIARVEA